MKIAIIGAGISGLGAAWLLQRQHEVTVLEQAERIGGHTATVDVRLGGRDYAVDTGFIVYNEQTYPYFIDLLRQLGVATQPTSMSFSVAQPAEDFEYCGSGLNGLFACRRHLYSPRFYGLLRDIVRFNRESVADLEAGLLPVSMTLGEYLERGGYGRWFRERYLLPMGAAIWSATEQAMLDFPLLFFVRFFRNHGLLTVGKRPQWRVVSGGSRGYLEPLTRGFADRIETSVAISTVQRQADGVWLVINGKARRFDQVVLACHADQALALLSDASPKEREILSALPYRDNEVVLHTDARVLPQRQRAWSSWNVMLQPDGAAPMLSYHMNRLQGIDSPEPFCVTLNPGDRIDPAKVLYRTRYAHPQFTLAGIAAQQRWAQISGPERRTHFCGAYWLNGFHEDGLYSAVRVAQSLGVEW